MQPHALNITVDGNGKVDVQVNYKDRVPDLMSSFSPEVRRRAALGLLFASRYEWKVLLACDGMPRWAVDTVRQHLMFERAVRIDARLKRRAERKRLRAEQQAVRERARQERRALRQARKHPPRPNQKWGPAIGVAEPSPAQTMASTASRSIHAEARARHPDVHAPKASVQPEVAVRARMDSPALASPTAALSRIGGPRQHGGSALGAPVPQRPSLTARLAELHGIEPAQPAPSHRRGRGR